MKKIQYVIPFLIVILLIPIGMAFVQTYNDTDTHERIPNPQIAKSTVDVEQLENIAEQLENIVGQLEQRGGMHDVFKQIGMIFSPRYTGEIINDNFDDGLDGWQHHTILDERYPTGKDNYILSNQDGIVHFSGDGFAARPGIIKQVSLPEGDDIKLTFDGKAEGHASSHKHIPNMFVLILDVDHNRLDKILAVASDQTVSPWQNISIDLTDYAGEDIKVFIHLADPWIADWNQAIWIDNVIITSS